MLLRILKIPLDFLSLFFWRFSHEPKTKSRRRKMYLLLCVCVCAQCSMMSPLSSPLCPCGNFLFKFYFFMHKNKWTDIQMKQQVSHIFPCIEWAGFHIHPSDRPSTWVCLCVIFTTFASCRPDLCIIFSHRHFPAKRKTCVSVGRVSFFSFL